MLKPDSCKGCALYNVSNGFIISEGNCTNGVAIIGEAAGYEEFLEGLPFRPKAQAGSKLEEVFKLISNDTNTPISRNQFILYNIINCNPPRDFLSGATWEQESISHCTRVHFSRFVESHSNIKCFVALGNISLKYLTGLSGIAEEKQSISHLRGYVLESIYENSNGVIPVICSYHPSFLKRGNGHLTPFLVEDLKKAIKVAKGAYTNYSWHKDFRSPKYVECASLEKANEFKIKVQDNQNLVISCDIETEDSSYFDEDERDDLESNATITQVQFSTSATTGIAMPFSGAYIDICKTILSTTNIKLGFNWWNFDSPRLSNQGIKTNGVVHDLMWMFKHWHPRLERGLQKAVTLFDFPFPWKHLYSKRLGWYGCADVDAVMWIWNKLPGLMKARGIWEGYETYTRRIFSPTLERASNIGIPVNEEKRINLKIELTKEKETLNTELQSFIPDEIKNLTPRRKDKTTGIVSYGYKRVPREIETAVKEYTRIKRHLLAKGSAVVSFRRFVKRKYGLVIRDFEEINQETLELEKVQRWCNIEEFNAGSSKQVIEYLKWKQNELLKQSELANTKKEQKELVKLAREYEVPIHLKTKKETTGSKELEEIYYATGDSVIDIAMETRSLSTNINNFIPNWRPSNDGRVHTEWNFGPPSGQLATRRPNVQNCSKHTKIGQRFRNIIEAPEGYSFVEFDKKSFHVATMGYNANSHNYIRFSQLDPHSIFTSYIHPSFTPVDFQLSDSDILSYCKEIKKYCKKEKESTGIDIRNEQAKPTVLGNQLGLGPIKLQRMNRRYIKSISEAKKFQTILSDMFPEVEEYKDYIRNLAFQQTYLINEFGFIQHFFDVFHWNWNKHKLCWNKSAGEEFNEPVGFKVQASAFGMMKYELLQIEEKGFADKYQFINTIHDSNIFLVNTSLVENCISDIRDIMVKPCSLLTNKATGPEGLRVNVDVSIGRNWQDYNEVSNPEGMREIKI